MFPLRHLAKQARKSLAEQAGLAVGMETLKVVAWGPEIVMPIQTVRVILFVGQITVSKKFTMI